MHFGRVHAGLAQQAGDVHERPAVLLVGRRVHDDEAAAVGERGAQVAAEAGVLGGGGESEARCRQRWAASQRSTAARRTSACIIENSNINRKTYGRSMPFRLATLALALAIAAPAFAQTQTQARRAGADDRRRRDHRGRQRHRGDGARQRRDPPRRHGDLRRRAALQPRARPRGRRRRRAAAGRRRSLLRSAPAVQHARRHRLLRAADLSTAARQRGARRRRAGRVPRQGQVPLLRRATTPPAVPGRRTGS